MDFAVARHSGGKSFVRLPIHGMVCALAQKLATIVHEVSNQIPPLHR